MKRFLCIILSILLAFSSASMLVACGGNEGPKTYTVSFKSDGAAYGTAQTIEEGKKASKPADPTKTASSEYTYTFAGWVVDANGNGLADDGEVAWNFDSTVTANLALAAKFTATAITPDDGGNEGGGNEGGGNEGGEDGGDEGEDEALPVTVTFMAADGTTVHSASNAYVGDYAEMPRVNPTKAPEGEYAYEFSYWVLDTNENGTGDEEDEEYSFDVELEESIVLYPYFEQFANTTVNVTFESDGENIGQITVYKGTLLQDNEGNPVAGVPAPTKANDNKFNYTFNGWRYNNVAWNMAKDTVTGDITLVAQFTATPVGGDSGDKTTIRLGGFASDAVLLSAYEAMQAEFNRGYGAVNKISLSLSITSAFADYQNTATTQLIDDKQPYHVYMINDRYFKTWAQNYGNMIRNIGDLTSQASFVDQLNGMWTGMIDRFRLNKDGWTSYKDDDLWAVPVDSNPTALYYNRTVLEKNGIIVISVEDITLDEATYDSLAARATEKAKADVDGTVGYYNGLQLVPKDEAVGQTLLDLWNAGEIEDMFGNKIDNLLFTINDGAYIRKYGTDGSEGNRIYPNHLASEGIAVPAKGFYRSVNPRDVRYETAFIAPANNEVLVFNASIAMSWDEAEDIAMMCTKDNKYNPQSASTYGLFTQWWFCYGWTVGGDCMEDMSGDGAWAFSLSDYTNNYLVREEACTESNPNNGNDPNKYYIGKWTGTLYSAGDTLAWLDKMDVNKVQYTTSGTTNATSGDIIIPATDGGFYKYNAADANPTAQRIGRDLTQIEAAGITSDNTGIRGEVRENASIDANEPGKKFVELPSTKEAFSRFCYLCPNTSDARHLGVSYPTTSGTSDETADITKLADGETLAFVIERGDKLGILRATAEEKGTSWGVANVPVFKEYDDSEGYIEPSTADVLRQGVQAGHSECVALGISAGCKDADMDEAWQVIQWMSADYYYIDHETGETYFGVQRSEYDTVCKAGQAVKAENGFIPNQAGLFESTGAGSSSFIKEGEENLNLHLFAYAIEYESAGDWWYLPNGSATWIQQWAGSLNSASGVRGGSLRISDWFSGVINGTNQVLHSTFNYYGDESGEAVNVKNLWNNNFGA